ncbi:MAG: hypothetical protein GTN70_03720, partial [Deltaproteobacteria bacterium]|nr:hypothetical protein [Deltaproteobacteria bacterium]
LPIDGLAYEDGQLTLNGVPVARLSGAETVRLAVKIAHHRVRERQGKFVLLDGLEKLHDDQRAAMLDEIRGSDVQWLMTEVGLRGNGEGVEVVVMGPASKQDKPVKGGSAPSKQGALDV